MVFQRHSKRYFNLIYIHKEHKHFLVSAARLSLEVHSVVITKQKENLVKFHRFIKWLKMVEADKIIVL